MQRSDQDNKSRIKEKAAPGVGAALDKLATILVPHSWFTSFYAVSVTCSLFWLSQILLPASLVTGNSIQGNPKLSMTWRQVQLTWILMLIQGSRRLYECITFYRPSQSQMWLGHWAAGVGFYLATSVAVWIEGLGQCACLPAMSASNSARRYKLTSRRLDSYDCHDYLASLKTSSSKSASAPQITPKTDYKLPVHPAFHSLVTPHYFAECIIYISLALVAAPQGAWLNWTIFSALVFVVVNLAITANGTKKWYEAKFGKASVEKKWRMIPYSRSDRVIMYPGKVRCDARRLAVHVDETVRAENNYCPKQHARSRSSRCIERSCYYHCSTCRRSPGKLVSFDCHAFTFWSHVVRGRRSNRPPLVSLLLHALHMQSSWI
nr:polyprenol reductase [Quercus suber]